MADEKWTTLARKWMFYLPPGRPSMNDLKTIQEVIRNRFSVFPKIEALILGATPEYRDLLYKLGAKVAVVDKNPDMIEAMSYLRVFESKEDIYVEDWFDFLPKYKDSFNLVMADFTQGNMHYDKHEEFYRLISNTLVKNGHLIERVLTFRNRSLVHSSTDLFNEFASSPLNLITLNNMMFKLFFTSDLVCKWGMVDVDRMYEVIQERSVEFPGIQKFIDFMKEFIFGEGIVWYYGKEWSKISKNYFKYLRLVEEIPDTESVYNGFAYIIVTTPEQKIKK